MKARTEQAVHTREVAALFLRLGCTAFGGPAAHIAMMRREVVEKRGWLEAQEFLDLVGAVNLVPGPNSTELALHIGQRRAGWPGYFAAGFGFIMPAVLLVLLLAMLYERFGALPLSQGILRGVAPVVVAIILHALIRFFPTAVKNRVTAVIAVLAFAAALWLRVELPILCVAAVIGLLLPRASTVEFDRTSSRPQEAKEMQNPHAAILFALPAVVWPPLVVPVFWTFLKIGSVLYGSGYVLIAFLQAEVVDKLKWVSSQQLLDGIAVGQFTPGPLFTTATFIGYQIGGVPTAIAATVGIFLPAFVFVALLAGFWKKLRAASWARGFLDSINAASFALMAVATLDLARGALWNSDGNTLRVVPLVLFFLSLALLLRTKINSTWLIAAGAVCGAVLTL
jgi:chromate transporter